jgi:multidrug efflux pump subunit AcrA (membrane-fusion protein)
VSTLIEPTQQEKQQKQQREQQEQQQAIVRSRLVAKLLNPVPDIREFLYNLVYTQAVVVKGTEAAAFLVEPGQEEGQIGLANVAHIRPDQSVPEVKQKALEAFGQLIGNCYRTGQDAAIKVQDDPNDLTFEPQYCLITLLRHENRIVAATAVVTRCRNENVANHGLEMMQLVAGYFDLWMLRRNTETLRVMAQNHQDVLQYASAISTSDGFQNAVNNVCNELATRTGATRVSIGWAKQRSDGEVDIKLAGLSHTEQFDKKQELSVQLIKVMEECVDQQEIVQYDPTDENATTQNVTREAQALSRMEGGNRVVSLPMRHKGEMVGVLTLEFPNEKKPSDHETTGLAVASEMLGPILVDRHANDRWLITKAGISTRETWKMLVGPKYWLAKLCVILGLVGLWALCGGYGPQLKFWEAPYIKGYTMTTYKVKAPFRFVSQQKRVVSVPFDGARLREVLVRPGDDVKQDQVLLRFDTFELTKKLIEARSEENRARIEYNRMIGSKGQNGQDQTSEAMEALAKAEGALARAEQIQFQIDQAEVKAPIAGKIMTGDLRDKVGATMKLGDELFQLAEVGKLRVEVTLNERDVQRIHEASEGVPASIGTISTSSRPDLSHPIVVERIVPAEQPSEGQNVFTVYAEIDQSKVDKEIAKQWLPGMAGQAALEEQPRTLLYQWTHRLVDWARLKLWIW